MAPSSSQTEPSLVSNGSSSSSDSNGREVMKASSPAELTSSSVSNGPFLSCVSNGISPWPSVSGEHHAEPGAIQAGLRTNLPGAVLVDQSRSQCSDSPLIVSREHQAEPGAVLVNQPRSRCAECAVASVFGFIVLGMTSWILAASIIPFIRHDMANTEYQYLLTVLSVCSLLASLYLFQIGWGAFMWTRKYIKDNGTDWKAKWEEKARASLPRRDNGGAPQQDCQQLLDWHSVQHFVVVTNYKEPIEVLRILAYTLMSQRHGLCRQQITLVLAFEDREAEAREKGNSLKEEFKEFFRDVILTFHPANIAGEIKGKASNYKWAVKDVEQYIRKDEDRIKEANCIIHVADADSLYDPNHFPCVTYLFCTQPDRYNVFYQPCMIPTLNFWIIPAPCRQLSTVVAAQEMMSANDPHEFQIPFSTYGVALQTLQRVGHTGDAADAQDGDVIAEDHHLFIKAFFALQGKLRVQPIFLPCLNFSVGGEQKNSYCSSLCSNLSDRFVQAKRHMFGVSEFFYLLVLIRRSTCGRQRIKLGCRGRIRLISFIWKMLKIHTVSYLGFWVTLGIALVAVLKVERNYCESHLVINAQRVNDAVCDKALTNETQTFVFGCFSIMSTLSLIGSMFVIISFVRMLKATEHLTANIGDPHGSFMGRAVFSMEARSRMGSSQDSLPDRRRGSHERSSERSSGWIRRPLIVGNGYPWCGAVTQLVVEFVVFGFITSIVYGTIPCLLALWHLVRRGHKLEYVAANAAGQSADVARPSRQDAAIHEVQRHGVVAENAVKPLDATRQDA